MHKQTTLQIPSIVWWNEIKSLILKYKENERETIKHQ